MQLVEVYGSLLNSKEREEISKRGRIREKGKVERRGWKLSFDRLSKCRQEAVLNLLKTGNPEDVYYTTIFDVDDKAYADVMNREMGEKNALKWKKRRPVAFNTYRPVSLESEFGNVDIFIIPEDERKPTMTRWEASYVETVRKGIEESYENPLQMRANLGALRKAVEDSKIKG